MKALSIAACIRPHPALLLIYAEHESISSKIRKRLMPVRDEQVANRSEVQELESLADHMIQRHPDHLPAVPRRILMQVLRVLQRIASGVSQSKAIREAELEFKDYQKKDKSKKRVSFREGPHDERHFDKDDDFFCFKGVNSHVADRDQAADVAAGDADAEKVGRLSADGGEEDSQPDGDDDDDGDDDQSSSQHSSASRDEHESEATAAPTADPDPDTPDFESEGDVENKDDDEVESPDEDESEIEAAAILSYDQDEDQDDELFVF